MQTFPSREMGEPSRFDRYLEVVSVKMAPIVRNMFCTVYERVTTRERATECNNLAVFTEKLADMQTLSDDEIMEYSALMRSQMPALDTVLANLYAESHVYYQDDVDAVLNEKTRIQFLRELFALIACAVARNLPLLRRKHVMEFQKVVAASLRTVCAAFVDIESLSSTRSMSTIAFPKKRLGSSAESMVDMDAELRKRIDIPDNRGGSSMKRERPRERGRLVARNVDGVSTATNDIANLADVNSVDDFDESESKASSLSKGSNLSKMSRNSSGSVLSTVSSAQRKMIALEKRKRAEKLLEEAEELDVAQTEIGTGF
jgi:hypothetical protein